MGGVNSLVFCSKSVAKLGPFFQIRCKTVHPGNGVHSHKKDEVVPVMLYCYNLLLAAESHMHQCKCIYAMWSEPISDAIPLN